MLEIRWIEAGCIQSVRVTNEDWSDVFAFAESIIQECFYSGCLVLSANDAWDQDWLNVLLHNIKRIESNN